MNNPDVSYVHEEAYEPNVKHNKSYTNDPRTNESSLSMGLEFNHSVDKPGTNEMSARIMNILDEDDDKAEQEDDQFALKF